MAIVLGPNQYGKAEVRLVHVDRSTPVHRIKDVNVTSQLFGDFTAATHATGDNSVVIATDTQKNTVYALARQGGVGAIEDFALRTARNTCRCRTSTTSSSTCRTGAWTTPTRSGSPRPPVRAH